MSQHARIYLEEQAQEPTGAPQQRLDPLLVGFLVLERGGEHITQHLHTLRHRRHEGLFVRVGVVERRDQERPLGLDGDVETQELAQLLQGLADGRIFAGPAVADADADLEGSLGWERKGIWSITNNGVETYGYLQVGHGCRNCCDCALLDYCLEESNTCSRNDAIRM